LTIWYFLFIIKIPPPDSGLLYSSNWSERHAAFVCGLCTFDLSIGLITTMYFPRDSRQYHNIYEYYSMCGACAKRCPDHAISLEHGKITPYALTFSIRPLQSISQDMAVVNSR
jgi:ferredoxin